MDSVRLLVAFAADLGDFRVPELEAAAAAVDVPIRIEPCTELIESFPFVYAWFPSIESAVRVIVRTVGVKLLLEPYADAPDFAGALAQFTHAPLSPTGEWVAEPTKSFCIQVRGYGRTYREREKLALLGDFAALFKGRVKLRDPTATYWLFPVHHPPNGDRVDESADPGALRRVLFARAITESNRSVNERYALSRRVYLGTTSMKAELSFIQANMAGVRPGSLVLDPFVGTGSLIVAAAEYGAFVFGGDISTPVIRGLCGEGAKRGDGVRRDVYANFVQYGTTGRFVDCLGHDLAACALQQRPMWDAIVTDPPYGIRAGAKRVGLRDPSVIPANAPLFSVETHVAQRVAYRIESVLGDLLDFAARSLVVGGRLTYWLPTTDRYTDADLPSHPALALVANSVQPLGFTFRRRLVTMVKRAEPAPDARAHVPDSIQVFNELAQPADTPGSAADADPLGGVTAGIHVGRARQVAAAGSAGGGGARAGIDGEHEPESLYATPGLSRREKKRLLRSERAVQVKRQRTLGDGALAPSPKTDAMGHAPE